MALSRLHQFEERLRRRDRISQVPLTRLRDRDNPLEYYNSVHFKQRYHMWKETAIFVAELISEDLTRFPLRRGVYLPPIIQLLAVLRFYATGSFQMVIGDLHTLSQGTVSNLVKRVSIAIAKHRNTYITYPTIKEANNIKHKFFEMAGFPGIFTSLNSLNRNNNNPTYL